MDRQNRVSITEFLAICTGTAFVSTIIYVYAFSLGMHWSNLFRYFVLDDYLKLAIQWLSPAALSFFIGALIGYIRSHFQAPTEAVDKAKSPSRKREILMFAMISIIFGSPVVGWVLYILGYKSINIRGLYGMSLFAIFFILISFYRWYQKKINSSIRERFAAFELFIFIAPFLILFALYKGFVDAEDVKGGIKQTPKTTLTLAEPTQIMQGQIIFILDKYVLFLKQNATTVSAIPSSLIRSIEELPDSKLETKQ